MTLQRRLCTECGDPLPVGSRTDKMTCSDKCRRDRSKRQRGLTKPKAPKEALPGIEIDVAREIAKEELRPVVREAITQEVLEAIGSLVTLVPEAVQAMAEQLSHPDPVIRQRAAKTVMQYTVGNPTVSPTPEAAPPAFVVNFEMPRPGGDGNGEDAVPPDAEVIEDETRTCQVCEADKPAAEFVGNSDRCQACHKKIQDKALVYHKEGDGE